MLSCFWLTRAMMQKALVHVQVLGDSCLPSFSNVTGCSCLSEADSGTERCAANLACVYAYDSHSGTEIGSAQPGIPRVDSLAQRVSSAGHEKEPARCFTKSALPAVRWWQDKKSQIKASYMPSPHEQVSHLSAFGLSIKFVDLNIIFNFGLQLLQ